MRRLLIWTSLIVLYANTIAQNTMNHSYKSAWDSLQKATDKGLIKDAIHINDGILARAKADHNAPEYLKAVIHKINFIKDREENGNRTSIVFIEKELAGATFPVKNLLHYLSATLYDDYYNNNRWQINQRTELDSSSQSMDIETWTTRQFFKKTTALYNASLENAAGLQKIKVSDYDAIITKSKGRHLRPTLFDFLAFEVFNHYDDQYDRDLTVQENFVITDDAYYADADVFVKLKPTSTNAYATKYNALLVLQSIIAFRKQQPEIPALIDAELIRLDFIDQLFTDKKKGEAYYKALSSLEKKYGKDSSSSQVSHRIAQYYQTLGSSYDAHKDTTQRWALKKAVDKCNEAISKYPKSYGASLCKQLLEMIKEQQLSFEGEEVISAGRPFKLYTKYKNLNEVEFRIYTINHTTLQKLTQKEERNYGEQNALKGYFAKISKSKPVRTKVLSLPQTNDFQLHSVELPFDPLAHGLYVVYVGPKGFTEQGLYTYELIQVSNLAYLENNSAGQKEIYVVNNHTGAAVPQARVEIWKEYYEYSKNRNVAQKIFDKTADAEGKVVAGNIWGDHYGSFFVNIKTKDDTLYNDLPSRYNNVRTPYGDTQEKVAVNEIKILTDRAIYRPGQTVYYKIIAFSNLNNKAEVLSKLSAAISLRDVNQKELVQHSFVTNEYGSAHGSFVLPSAGLTGYHTLQVVGNGVYGNQGMRVEEYKRPKFEAKFDTLRETYKLNDEVTVTVAALSYAGAAIDQAQVRYKVNRTYRYPEYWYKCGFYWLPTPKSVQISVGEASTDANGKAAIKFKAIPDQDAYQRDKAIFLYEVIADITDINGETRSATTYVNIGEASYQINTSIPERIVLERRANLSIQVENLNDQAIKNTAEVEIIKLQDPTKYFKPRYWARPSQFIMTRAEHDSRFPEEVYDAENLVINYPVGASVYKQSHVNEGTVDIAPITYQNWELGAYVVKVKATNEKGEVIEEKFYFTLDAEQKSPKHVTELVSFSFDKSNLVPNDTLQVYLKSQDKGIRVFYQLASENQKINQWLAHKAIAPYTYKIEHPGYVNAAITYIWHNRKYDITQSAFVSNVDKELHLKFETFRDKLLPGQKETWKIKIQGHKSQKVNAELLALLYDASLDQFASHNIYFSYLNYGMRLQQAGVGNVQGYQYPNMYSFVKDWGELMEKEYDTWKYYGGGPYRVLMGRAMGVSGGAMRKGAKAESMQMLPPSVQADEKVREDAVVSANDLAEAPASLEPQAKSEAPDKPQEEPQIRKNFQETAFFYPDLTTDSAGGITVNFTIPEALTRWQMYGLAHTKDMKLGFLSNQLITQKDLMVSPNVPRFLREGDLMTLQAKVNNMTDRAFAASAKIEFFDAFTLAPLNKQILDDKDEKPLSLAPRQSNVVEWKIKVPEGVQAITYRVYASSDSHTDAEENTVLVLSNKLLVTETLPINVGAGQTKTVTFDKLASHTSTTLRHHKLTFEYTSNPAWYAVQALPYLMEYPYECAEQVFSRYYANDLASYISNKHPKIKQVFDIWKSTDSKALLSNLEKNQELKQIMIEETPWLRDAADETEAKKRIATLFDVNRMGYEKTSSLQKLQKMQMGNGAFPWFSGMYPDRYITQYITAGIGHLAKIKGSSDDVEASVADRALEYLDDQLINDLNHIKKEVAEKRTTLAENHLEYLQIHYLYTRSFFGKEMGAKTKEAHAYFLGQAEKYALKNNRYAQGMIAIALFRNGKVQAAQDLLKSISQYALESEEMGLYWKESYGHSWYDAPVESHALMVEAYGEILNDSKTIDKLKLWLLKQKQTTRWATTKATSEACYALLLKGSDFLAEDAAPAIKLGAKTLEISSTEEGTGYFKVAYEGKEINKEMAKVTVSNSSKVVNWGALYWQYFENMDKVTQANTSLSIQKTLFLHHHTDKGDQLAPLPQSTLKVGDLITVRMVIKTDRNLEYVHLKDMRSAGFEPVNVTSGYRWKGGLGYYESTRDASTNFFIGYLAKGSYVFEYQLRVSHKGDFSNGVTSIQCMYAPEFSSHSEGIRVLVK